MKKNEEIKIGCVQLYTEPGRVESNVKKMLGYIEKAKSSGVDIVCFHELLTCDYYVKDVREFGESIPGPTTEKVSKAARKYGIYVIFGLPELYQENLLNTTVLIDREGKVVGRYHKTHLSVTTRKGAIQREVDVFQAGNTYPVFNTEIGKIGMMICKDGLYPEVSRILSLKGCELLFWLNNRGGLFLPNCQSFALLSQVLFVACNRAGNGVNGGGSVIVDLDGEIIAQANRGETILVVSIDMAKIREKRRAWFQETRIRRPETYSELLNG